MTTPVASGPGALSRRTDTGPAQKLRDLPDADYGEGATYKDLQRSARLAQDQTGNVDPRQAAGAAAAASVIPMNAPSQQPGTPVTAGAALGMGPGTEALGLPDQTVEDMSRYLPWLPVLEYMANQEGASWAMRNVVRRLKAMV